MRRMVPDRVRPVMRILPLAATLLLAGCVAAPDPPPAKPGPRFDAIAFFAGRSQGAATLRQIFKSPHAVRVRSRGVAAADGTLVLDQIIAEPGKPARRRQWRIREDRPDHYVGTLTDAASPVSGETVGNRLHLAFQMKGGLATDQWLTLAPDGQSAHNILIVRKFGVTLAVLDETIRKIG